MRMQQSRTSGLAALAFALGFGASAMAWSDDAVLARKSPLLASPEPGAREIASLPERASLSVLERKGGWYKVRAQGGEEGWVRLLAVRLSARPADPGAADGSGDAAGAALTGAQSGGTSGAAAGAIGSMVTGSAADSTAVRGGSSGNLSGQHLLDPATGEGSGSSLEQVETFKPSDADMDDFEKGLDAPQGEAPTQ